MMTLAEMPGRHRPIYDGRDGAIDGVTLGEQPRALTQSVVGHDRTAAQAETFPRLLIGSVSNQVAAYYAQWQVVVCAAPRLTLRRDRGVTAQLPQTRFGGAAFGVSGPPGAVRRPGVLVPV
jgi:hypothetical protein